MDLSACTHYPILPKSRIFGIVIVSMSVILCVISKDVCSNSVLR
jgi:hypothetical protein